LINFKNINTDIPFKEFRRFFKLALDLKQENIDAMLISSYSHLTNEVNSRFVNLKTVDNDNFIFFSNYESPKSKDFLSHPQISAVIFWSRINLQIRIKAKIKKISNKDSDLYFKSRDITKNALAISSKQSRVINSYNEILKRYNHVLEVEDLTRRPNYWGGFSFSPYYFEFWEGHKSRLNKRNVYQLNKKEWVHSILEP